MRNDDDVLWHIQCIRMHKKNANPKYKILYFTTGYKFVLIGALFSHMKIPHKLIIDKNKKYFCIIIAKK
jgi:hypothetical protein